MSIHLRTRRGNIVVRVVDQFVTYCWSNSYCYLLKKWLVDVLSPACPPSLAVLLLLIQRIYLETDTLARLRLRQVLAYHTPVTG